MIKTKVWVTLIGTVLVLSAGVVFSPKPNGSVAKVYQNGRCIHTVELSQVEEAYELPVETDDGVNRIRVEPGRICMLSADCPDQTCVKMGWSDECAGNTIVCLPHRLAIQMETSDMDSIAG